MIEPPIVTLPAGWTNTPYVQAIRFPGQDLTGAAFKMEVRLYAGAPGAALAEFFISPSVAIQPNGVPLTVLTVSLSEAQVGDLPTTGEPGRPAEYAFDLICTPAGGFKSVMLAGTFPVRRGVTRT